MGVSYARVKTPLPHILFPARCITEARRSAANIAELPDLLQSRLWRGSSPTRSPNQWFWTPPNGAPRKQSH